MVGDDDQSIYGWRGAETANLLDLERHFPGVKVIRLEQNYRSTDTILSPPTLSSRITPAAAASSSGPKTARAPESRCTPSPTTTEARQMAKEIEYARLARGVPWREQAVLFRTTSNPPAGNRPSPDGIRYQVVGGQSYFDRREIKDFLAYLRLFVNPDDDISLFASPTCRRAASAT